MEKDGILYQLQVVKPLVSGVVAVGMDLPMKQVIGKLVLAASLAPTAAARDID